MIAWTQDISPPDGASAWNIWQPPTGVRGAVLELLLAYSHITALDIELLLREHETRVYLFGDGNGQIHVHAGDFFDVLDYAEVREHNNAYA